MRNGTCPLCFTKVPRLLVLSRSYDLTCPACQASLEVSRGSRILASGIALAAGFCAARFVHDLSETAAWTWSVAVGIVTFALASALLLGFFAALVVRPEELQTDFPHPRS